MTTAAPAPTPATTGQLAFAGRVRELGPRSGRYAWSGAGFIAHFVGTGFDAELEDAAQFHTLVVDGTVSTLETSPGRAWYSLASGLPNGEHVVELYRQTEAFVGVTTLHGVAVRDGELAAPPSSTTRRLEFVGDSITAGYGNEGANTGCSFSPETENHYLTYGAVAARALGARASTLAWSGRGVVKNYDGGDGEFMPALYDRTLPQEGDTPWSFVEPVDAVVINLGTNDFSTAPDPTVEDFAAAYEAFLRHIREKNPNAFILGTVGPMLQAADLALARQAIERAVERRHKAGDTRVGSYLLRTRNEAPGCDWHPSVKTHQAMADELVGQLKQHLGW